MCSWAGGSPLHPRRRRGPGTSARPGGSASAFCAPVRTKSSCHSSVSTGNPANEVTASTRSITSSNSCTTAASSSRGAKAPVDVSECTKVTASTSLRVIASRSMSGSTVLPGATSSVTTSRPHAWAMAANRFPKAPLTTESTRWRTPDRIAISMNAVAEHVPTTGRPAVRNRERRPSCIPARSSVIAFPRWGIMGRVSAVSTSGWTSVGPGRKNRPNDVVIQFTCIGNQGPEPNYSAFPTR